VESIGERIKTLRTEKGMTLAELGEKANLSISYLSQIERDKTSPSLTTLETIAKSLNTGLRYLFESDNEAPYIVRGNKGVPSLRTKALIDRQPLTPLSGNPEIEVYRITLQPNSAMKEIEQFAGEEIIFVLQGELTISIGDEQFTLKTGDSIHYDALLKHQWENASDQPCVIIWGGAQALSESLNAPRMWNKNLEDNGS
jgi:transcriptional regulator with XRE-family HTH domain